jgi:hypothetical protein
MLATCFVFLLESYGNSPHRFGAINRRPSPEIQLSVPPPPSAEWTIMVFMNGDNDLERFAIEDFQEMANVTDSDRVNVIVQFDRTPNWDGRYGNWTQTLRYRLRRGLTPTVENALPGFNQETNMGHPDVLRDFVVWARETYPARRYMLIIWDHGDGWRRLHTVSTVRNSPAAVGIRRLDVAAAESAGGARGGNRSRSSREPMIPLDRTIDAPFRTISVDETDRDRFYVREIQMTLEPLFDDGGRLEVIGFDACLMAMMETAYAMRRVANVMVGSEELEPGAGWQYDDWLQQLVNNPTMDGVELGRVLVDSYRRTYEEMLPATTLSAIDLSQNKMAELAASITAFAAELTSSLDSDMATIRSAREACIPYAPGEGFHGIDLRRFCQQVSARTSRPELRARADAVVQLLTAFTKHNYAGSARQAGFGSHGLAIYFPKNASVYMSDPYGGAYRDENEVYPVEFVREHGWDNFLHAYFARVP